MLEGFEPYELLYLSRQASDRVAKWLEDRAGMKLGRGTPTRCLGFQVKDPFGKFVVEYMTVKNDIGSIDASPPSREGHLDIWSPDYAREYLLIPARLGGIEKILKDTADSMNVFSEAMKQHMKLIQSLTVTTHEIRDLVKFLEKLVRPGEKPEPERKKPASWEI